MNSPQQIIEQFHLLFLLHLAQTIDGRCCILKGGCNLRFFMQSIRYSEDIDLDIHTMAKQTLEKNVDKILTSLAFIKTLQTKNITLSQFSKPKQTETTQRWKILLQHKGSSLPIPTKIEFSCRRSSDFYLLDQIDANILHNYALLPIFIQHYTSNEALTQKIEALALRTETQCRDIFDIHHLIAQKITISRSLSLDIIKEAANRCFTLPYNNYMAQVVAYLEPHYQTIYADKARWESMQLSVAQWIEKQGEENATS